MIDFVIGFVGSQAGLVVAFLLAATLVILAGVRMSVYGDALGDRTGLGKGLVGLIFLAGVTSLPELVVSLTSVINTADPTMGADLAVGNMLGSNLFNLLILALLILLLGRWFDPRKLRENHTDSMVYGLILLGVFAVAFSVAPVWSLQLPGLGCDIWTLLLPIIYLVMLRRENRRPKMDEVVLEEAALPEEQVLVAMPASRFYSVLSLLCLVIIGGGVALSVLGARMALPPEQGGFGLEASLIGTLFLAISTSLPELVISVSSVRLGFLDMSVGNVLGSNMFNLLIVFAADVAMRSEAILAVASRKNGWSAGMVALFAVVAYGLLKVRSVGLVRLLAVAMILVYSVSFVLLNR